MICPGLCTNKTQKNDWCLAENSFHTIIVFTLLFSWFQLRVMATVGFYVNSESKPCSLVANLLNPCHAYFRCVYTCAGSWHWPRLGQQALCQVLSRDVPHDQSQTYMNTTTSLSEPVSIKANLRHRKQYPLSKTIQNIFITQRTEKPTFDNVWHEDNEKLCLGLGQQWILMS